MAEFFDGSLLGNRALAYAGIRRAMLAMGVLISVFVAWPIVW